MALKIFKVEPEATKQIKALIATDAFARKGYIFRQGSALGLKDNAYYLYINAEEAFFKEHEKQLLVKGVTETKGKDYDTIKKTIEDEEKSAEVGVGSVFANF